MMNVSKILPNFDENNYNSKKINNEIKTDENIHSNTNIDNNLLNSKIVELDKNVANKEIINFEENVEKNDLLIINNNFDRRESKIYIKPHESSKFLKKHSIKMPESEVQKFQYTIETKNTILSMLDDSKFILLSSHQ